MGDNAGKTIAMTILSLMAIISILLASQPALSWQPGIDWANTYIANGSGTTVLLTSDGGYMVAGTAVVNGSGDDVLLVKTDAHGSAIWSRTYGGTGDEFGMSMVQTSDGGYVVAGIENGSQALLLKTDASGNLLWSHSFGGSGVENGMDVKQAVDGGFVITGKSGSGAGTQVLLIKTDAGGNLQWSHTYGLPESSDSGYAVLCCSDGGFMIAGDSISNGSSAYVVKTDASGTLLWNKTYGGAHSAKTYAIIQGGSGYEIAGDVIEGGIHAAYLLKIDTVGNEMWNQTYYGSGNDWYAKSLAATGDGYVLAGMNHNTTTGTDSLLMIKTGTDGSMKWSGNYGILSQCMGFSVQRATDGTYVAAGTAYNSSGFYAILLKTNASMPPSTSKPPITVINLYWPADVKPTTAPWISPTPVPTPAPTLRPAANTTETPTVTATLMPSAVPDSNGGLGVPIAIGVLGLTAVAAGAIYLSAFRKK